MRAQASPATVSLFEGLPQTLELDIRAEDISEGARVTVCYFLSPELAQWIHCFDRNAAVEPIKATLNKCDYHRADLEKAA